VVDVSVRIAVATLARKIVGADSWVVGYPKCGNTWFGVMLRKALTMVYGLDEAAIPRILSDWRFRQPFTGVPAIGVTHHMPLFNVESYRDMTIDLGMFRRRNVVLLVREPKDMLVSLYMHNVYRETTPLYQGNLESMVYSDVYGIEKFLKYYVAWHAQRAVPQALMVLRYEDLLNDTETRLGEALEFLKIPRVDRALVREVVAYGSFKNMRKLERTQEVKLRALAPPAHPREEAFQVRKGLVGDHVNHLAIETIRYIDHRVEADLPAMFGYPFLKPEAVANNP
jgi:hypothetical protein